MNGLRDIERLSRMILDAELAGLKQMTAVCARNDAQLRALEQEKQRLMAMLKPKPGGDPEPGQAMMPAWLDWQRARRVELNLTGAGLRAEREAQLALARHALGRAQAVDALIDRSQVENRIRMTRRTATGE